MVKRPCNVRFIRGRPGQRRGMSASDEALLARIRGGDNDAFAALYDRHAPRVFGVILRIIGDRCEAEDVLQETFWQVWRQAAAWRPERGAPLVWIAMIARSRAIDRLRRRKAAIVASDVVEAAAAAPQSDVEREEQAHLTRSILRQLPPEQMAVISLAFFCGMTHEQIAQEHDIPLGTVKTRIRRGMQRLRAYLTEREAKSA
ncbi:MAG: sigma-70 family RNA polymerase sigma factor [Phycisphaerales bacterium]|nr:MAG: sigma-70 family RNA polymerase sigma factor [Phycisphaerales bacterium]